MFPLNAKAAWLSGRAVSLFADQDLGLAGIGALFIVHLVAIDDKGSHRHPARWLQIQDGRQGALVLPASTPRFSCDSAITGTPSSFAEGSSAREISGNLAPVSFLSVRRRA